jgi:hypothetical protein
VQFSVHGVRELFELLVVVRVTAVAWQQVALTVRPTWRAWGDMGPSAGKCKALCNSLRLVAFQKHHYTTKTLATYSAEVFHCVKFVVSF